MYHHLKKALFFIFLLCLLYPAQAQTGFDKIYSFYPAPQITVYSYVQSVLADSQRIFIAGATQRDTLDGGRFSGSAAFIAGLDYSGNLLWQKRLVPSLPRYKSTDVNLYHTLAKAGSNRYVLGGESWDITDGLNFYFPRPFLYFFNGYGDSLRFVPIPFGGTKENNYMNAIMIDKQMNIVATGANAYWNGPDSSGFWISKFDNNGNFFWRKRIFNNLGIAYASGAYKIITANDNQHYVLAGEAGNPDTSQSSYAFFKTDTAGNLIWQRNLPKMADWRNNTFYGGESPIDIVAANNHSGYYFMALQPHTVRYPEDPAGGFSLIYYCGKIDEDGKLVWGKTYERDSLHSESSKGIQQKANGDLLFFGQSTGGGPAENTASSGASMFCTDSLGHVKWFKVTRRYNCTNDIGHILNAGTIAPNGNIVRGGSILQWAPQPGCYDTADNIAWVVMTDSLGRKNPSDMITYPVKTDTVIIPIDTGTNPTAIHLLTEEEMPSISLYPNPVTDVLHISLCNFTASSSDISVRIFDYMGRSMALEKLRSKSEVIDMNAYRAGIYLIKVFYRDKEIGSWKVTKN